jgi:plasmid stability protein
MSTITIHQLEPDIAKQLEQRAAQHGHTIEAEIKAILKSVLVMEPNLVEAIEKHFVHLGKFELPEIPREPMRPLPTFVSGQLRMKS